MADKKRNKIFIPLSITDTVSGYSFFLSNGKVALMLIYWVFVTLGTVLLKGILMSPLALIIYLGIAFFLFTYIVRFKVLEERRLQKLYNEQLALNPSKLQPFWKIIDINKNGLIRYDLNKAGLIIRIDKSTIVGREEGFKEFHYVARSNMLRYLLEKGYNILYINTEHQHNLREKVAGLYALTNKETDIVRDIFSAELSYVVANSYLYGIQETEYYLVLTQRYGQIKDLEKDCLTALAYIQHTAVSNTGILEKDGVLSLIKHLNGINYMDVEELIVNEIQTPVKNPVKFSIIREYDNLGIEKISIEIPEEQQAKQKRKSIFDKKKNEEPINEVEQISYEPQDTSEDDIFSLLNEIDDSNKAKNPILNGRSSNTQQINKNKTVEFKEETDDFSDLEDFYDIDEQ